jgi:uncharacterized protein (TIGR03083 family)
MIDYPSVIRENAVALAESVRAAGLDAPVPTCPDWKTADLAAHITGVHTWVEMMVRTRSQERIDREALPPMFSEHDGVDAVCIGVQERAGALIKTLSEADPDEPVWNWSVNQPKTAAFWPRRMAQETVIHRADADSAAANVPTVVPTDVAVDGIDELLTVFLPARASFLGNVSLGGSLHVHTEDGGGEWLVRCEGAECSVTREHAKGDAAVRGGASELLLFMWNRAPVGTVETFGDQSVIEAWRSFAV